MNRAGFVTGSANQWNESADPDPYQNITDPHHRILRCINSQFKTLLLVELAILTYVYKDDVSGRFIWLR
jgi:hypothetical protein